MPFAPGLAGVRGQVSHGDFAFFSISTGEEAGNECVEPVLRCERSFSTTLTGPSRSRRDLEEITKVKGLIEGFCLQVVLFQGPLLSLGPVGQVRLSVAAFQTRLKTVQDKE